MLYIILRIITALILFFSIKIYLKNGKKTTCENCPYKGKECNNDCDYEKNN